jgi:hypothetical protein
LSEDALSGCRNSAALEDDAALSDDIALLAELNEDELRDNEDRLDDLALFNDEVSLLNGGVGVE